MKRVLTFLAILLLPLSLWAMTPVTDSDLSNVTGQAGVNINANVTMDINIGTLAWGDSDGIKSVYNPWQISGTATTGGYIGISGFNITDLTIKARTETTDSYGHYNTLMLKPITIDVATGTQLGVTGTTFVRFGLGALQINMDSLQFDVALGGRVNGTNATAGTNAVVLNQNLGQVSIGDLAVYINPWSYVDIFSARLNGDTSGVCFAVNVTLDKFAMDYATWGDKDGYTAGNNVLEDSSYWMNNGTFETAGYIGIDDFLVNGPIAINGNVQIDVTTSAAGIYAQLPVFVANLPSSISMATQGTFLYTLSAYYATANSIDVSNATYAAYLTANSLTSTQLPYTAWVIGVCGHDAGVWAATRYATATTPAAVSVVHISFPYSNFVVDVQGSITGAVRLGSSYNFATGNTADLGDIYISGFKMSIDSGSWVDIWAH